MPQLLSSVFLFQLFPPTSSPRRSNRPPRQPTDPHGPATQLPAPLSSSPALQAFAPPLAMPPKRSAPTNGARSPAKRAKTIGAPSIADDSSRLIAAHHLAEHVGQGRGYLSTRPDPFQGHVPSLSEISLRVSAEVLFGTLKLPPKPAGGSVSLVGWDKERRQDDEGRVQMGALREFVRGLPSPIANRLLSLTLQLSSQDDEPISVLALSTLFLHPNTTVLSLSGGISLPVVLLSKIPDCTALTYLNLASSTTLTDASTAKVLASLSRLERVVLRGCTKVGDASVIALSKATQGRLREVNLSMCAVTIKGLTSLLARCSGLEVLKLANMSALVRFPELSMGLDDANVLACRTRRTSPSSSATPRVCPRAFLLHFTNKLIPDAALGYRHVPLSNLHTLKLRSTETTDSSLGRLLALCSLSLAHLDISYTLVKSLDIVSSALHTAPEWRLEKLVASGLPLSSASLRTFFEPLSTRPLVERSRFKTLKLGAIPANSSRAPGLTDAVLEKILPFLEELPGLENVSLFQNWDLGKREQPMRRFMQVLGRRCKVSFVVACCLSPEADFRIVADARLDVLHRIAPPRRTLRLPRSRRRGRSSSPSQRTSSTPVPRPRQLAH